MKILLVNPPSESAIAFPPLGLLYLAAYLRERAPTHSVSVIDAHLDRTSGEQLERRMALAGADIIGITSLSTNHHNVVRTAEYARRAARYVVVGGPHASAYGEDLAQHKSIDFVVSGEGEIPMLHLIEDLAGDPARPPGSEGDVLHGDARIITPDADGSSATADIDELPFPAWDLLRVQDYFQSDRQTTESRVTSSRKILPLLTSRGCPFGCAYCHNIFGRRFRAHSAERVVEEIERLVVRYGVEEIEIIDDTFNFDPRRLRRFCDLYRRRGLITKLSFPNGLRADLLTPDLIDALVDCGMYRVAIAVESASERIRHLANRNFDWHKSQVAIEHLASRKVITGGLFMLGFPGETREEMDKTVDYAVRAPFDLASFSLVKIFKNTTFHAQVVAEHGDQDFPPPEAADLTYYTATTNYSEVPSDELVRLQRRAYLRFYSRPGRVLSIGRKVRPSDIGRNTLGLVRYLANAGGRLYFS